VAKCPHCDKPVVLNCVDADKKDEVRKEVKGTAKKEVMYSCPHCERVLGFGFFLGGLFTGRP
jgi:phage terminase large subunit GpA-like protein